MDQEPVAYVNYMLKATFNALMALHVLSALWMAIKFGPFLVLVIFHVELPVPHMAMPRFWQSLWLFGTLTTVRFGYYGLKNQNPRLMRYFIRGHIFWGVVTLSLAIVGITIQTMNDSVIAVPWTTYYFISIAMHIHIYSISTGYKLIAIWEEVHND